MKTKHFKSVLLVVLVTISLIIYASPVVHGQGEKNEFTTSPTSASPARVRFDISRGAIFAYFSVECVASSPDVQLTPGSSTTISFIANSAPAEVGVEVLGQTASQSFDTPIGTLSIPVFTVGVATVNVDIVGGLDGTISASGPGSVSKRTLSWSGWGTQSVTVTISPDAEPGNTIRVTLLLEYTVDIGASASIPIVGRQTIGSISAAELSGSPSVTTTIQVVQPEARVPLAIPWTLIGGIVLIVIIIAIAVVVIRKG
jgi:hypothetical protein